MKKTAVLMLAALMTLLLMSPALAVDVSASYSDGKLTVSTTTSGYFKIIVDGVGTGKTVTPSVPTITIDYPLSEGQHKISLQNDVRGGGSTTITVGKTEAGPVPTARPAASNTPHEHSYQPLAASAPTCTQKGYTEGEWCVTGGEITREQEEIPALGHRYAFRKLEGSKASYRCVRCGAGLTIGAKETPENRFGMDVLVDRDGKGVEYSAKAEEGAMVIRALRQGADADVGLHLDTGLIMFLIREGSRKVSYVNGVSELEIDLNAISPSWFDTGDGIGCYIFTTNAAEKTLKVEGVTSLGERLEAREFTGAALAQ